MKHWLSQKYTVMSQNEAASGKLDLILRKWVVAKLELRTLPLSHFDRFYKTIISILIISVPLLNMTSAAPLSVMLSLLSQRKEGKRGRSVSHV